MHWNSAFVESGNPVSGCIQSKEDTLKILNDLQVWLSSFFLRWRGGLFSFVNNLLSFLFVHSSGKAADQTCCCTREAEKQFSHKWTTNKALIDLRCLATGHLSTWGNFYPKVWKTLTSEHRVVSAPSSASSVPCVGQSRPWFSQKRVSLRHWKTQSGWDFYTSLNSVNASAGVGTPGWFLSNILIAGKASHFARQSEMYRSIAQWHFKRRQLTCFPNLNNSNKHQPVSFPAEIRRNLLVHRTLTVAEAGAHEQEWIPSPHISTSTVWLISAPRATRRIPACSCRDFNYQKRQSLPLRCLLLLSQPPSSSAWVLPSPPPPARHHARFSLPDL